MKHHLIEARHLDVCYPGGVQALRDVSLDVYAGETFGIVGESGCGKSTLGGALIGDVPGAGEVTAGQVILHHAESEDEEAIDLVTASSAVRRNLWGRRLAMVFQDPYAAMNPGYTLGEQIDEAARRRPELAPDGIRARTLELLEQVHMPTPQQIVRRYPHQLSGGQQQRAVIAMALAANPDILILDEPTTGLDVTTEARILDLLLELKQTVHAGIIFITHNLAVIAQIADRVGVMYAGEFVEIGTTHDIFQRPSMPYTAGLLACIPRIDHKHVGVRRLRTISGSVPSPQAARKGCAFAQRCPFTQKQCRQEAPELEPTAETGHQARCFFSHAVRQEGWPDAQGEPVAAASRQQSNVPLLKGQQLSKVYGRDVRKYWLAGPIMQHAASAVNRISFDLKAGETLGIVGESGCGKTTLVNCVSGLIPASHGNVVLEKQVLAPDVKNRPRTALQRIQMVFQNPDLSLNPKHTVAEMLTRAVQVLDGRHATDALPRVIELLQQVGLGRHYLHRRPSELSGGEKQRVAVARALAGHPDVLLADEITSALDVSVRAAVLNLLNDLQRRYNMAYLFISHDMSAIRHVSDRVMVLYLGMIMEVGPVEEVFEPPFHPYTEALMSAIPVPDPTVKSAAIQLEGTIPGAGQRPRGCPFHTRCPRRIDTLCDTQEPPWRTLAREHRICCHLY